MYDLVTFDSNGYATIIGRANTKEEAKTLRDELNPDLVKRILIVSYEDSELFAQM
jgi:hypothetical protein